MHRFILRESKCTQLLSEPAIKASLSIFTIVKFSPGILYCIMVQNLLRPLRGYPTRPHIFTPCLLPLLIDRPVSSTSLQSTAETDNKARAQVSKKAIFDSLAVTSLNLAALPALVPIQPSSSMLSEPLVCSAMKSELYASLPKLIMCETVGHQQHQTLKRLNVSFVTRGAKKLDLLLGRTAHLLFLERIEWMHMFLDVYYDYLL